MARTRTIYSHEGLFVGPAPATGYHFISSAGVLNNNITTGDNFNLIKSIPRVISINYSFNTNKIDIQGLGKTANIYRHNTYSTVNLDFSYYQFGILNELRLGFLANYTRFDGVYSGTSYSNVDMNPLASFVYRGAEIREPNQLGWPLLYRDMRNFFVAVAPYGEELNKHRGFYEDIDHYASNYGVFGFGNCFINSYSSRGAVGTLPVASVSYICDNVMYFSSGNGAHIPAVNPTDGEAIQNINFALPSPYVGVEALSVLRPGDILLSMSAHPHNTNITAVGNNTGISNSANVDKNLLFSFSDLKIQSYNLNINIPRRELYEFGYSLPVDKILQFPIYADLNFEAIVGDGEAGSFIDALNDNDNYDIILKLNNPSTYGIPLGATAIMYNFKGAKLENISVNSDIGSNKIVNCAFRTEFELDDTTKKALLAHGMTISGLINVNEVSMPSLPAGNFVDELGNTIVDESGNAIFSAMTPVFF